MEQHLVDRRRVTRDAVAVGDRPGAVPGHAAAAAGDQAADAPEADRERQDDREAVVRRNVIAQQWFGRFGAQETEQQGAGERPAAAEQRAPVVEFLERPQRVTEHHGELRTEQRAARRDRLHRVVAAFVARILEMFRERKRERQREAEHHHERVAEMQVDARVIAASSRRHAPTNSASAA